MSFQRLFLTALILIPFQLLGNENHYTLDFSQIEGNALEWFEKNGWAEQVDMDKMNPRFEKGTLVIEPKDDYSGVFFKDFRPDSRQLKGVNKIRIEWGVEQYPEGSDWSGSTDEKRNVRNAIGVMVFFGDEDQDSGVFYVPNIPYFLAFFLGEKERPGKAYLGNYWQKAGRYFCTHVTGKLENSSPRWNFQKPSTDNLGLIHLRFREFPLMRTPLTQPLKMDDILNPSSEKLNCCPERQVW